jgi:amino acid adenylation domain-containing protein
MANYEEALRDEPEQEIAPVQRAISQRELQKSLLLSSAQLQIWLLDRLKPGNPAYNRSANIRISGHLKVAVLEQGLNEIIRRHEVLRTNFPSVHGKPAIAITPSVHLSLSILDFCDFPPREQQEKLQQLAIKEALTSLDLAQDLLIRAILVQLNNEEHILLLTFHHIIFDAWSIEILLKELAVLYNAFVSGEPSPLQELPLQYTDFAYWQIQQLQGEKFAIDLDYWRRQMEGELPVLDLPIDKQRGTVQTFHGARYNLKISSSLTTELKLLSQREGATLYMTLLTAFKILIYRYTNQEDIIVGSPDLKRDYLEIDRLIGVFVNTLVLRTQLTSNLAFRDLLACVRKTTLDAYKHRDLPFAKLVEELHPERSLSHTPIFQVLFQLRNLPEDKMESGEVKFEEFKLDNGIVALELALDIHETNSGLSCLFEYNTDLFEATTIERMAGHFKTLLEGIIANPGQLIRQLPLLTKAEQYQLLVEWNDTQTNYSQNKCIHQLFEAQVEKTPDAIAVVFGEEQLTYKQLNQRANQLAHFLQKLAVAPDTLVGICVERSAEMLISLLAVLKAGGAYVPLDPHYPQERLAFMLSDAQLSVLLTQERFSGVLPTSTIPTICLDRDWNSVTTQPDLNLVSETTPENLAYVIYTSGSTGTPKGVLVQHNSLVNFTEHVVANYEITASDRVLQFASISFDAAAEEIYPCLVAGGTLVLRNDDMLSSLERFLKTCLNWQITVLDLPTAFWQQIVLALAANEVTLPPCLRLIIIGGERVSPEYVFTWQAHVGNFPQLLNTYGPTEATVVATTFLISASTPIHHEVPIGRAISNVQTYVLDVHLQPVPIGVPGELYIGGSCLARGYFNRSELTTERFISHPFLDALPARLYKTGDRVRYLPNGHLEFLGRIDDQVKIRGFRVELGEIETVLAQHPQVQAGVVIACAEPSGSQRLVAYLVIAEPLNASELRAYLKERLPYYMIPAALVFLAALPLTPSGKVDRRALPLPDLAQIRQESEGTFVAPRDELELLLIEIWEKVLGVQPIGVKDNFFNLGGHSLLATQLFAQIEERLTNNLSLANLSLAHLSLATIFQAPTVEELAKVLRYPDWKPSSYSLCCLVPIQPEVSRPPLFGIHLNYFRDLLLYLEPGQPVYTLRYGIAEPVNKPITLPKMEELAAHYIQEIRSIQPEGPYFLMGLSTGGIIAYEMAQQLVAKGQQVPLLVLFDSFIEIEELLPLSQRLSNLMSLGPAEFLRKVINKMKRSLSFLKTTFTDRSTTTFTDRHTSPPPYFPHMWTPDPSFHLEENYTPKAYSGRIILFQAMGEPTGEDTSLVQDNKPMIAPEIEWQRLVKGELEIHQVFGGHTEILEEPNVQVLAEKFKICLDRALAEAKKSGFHKKDIG